MSCLYAAARSSGVSVWSLVRSSHLPSRCASRAAAPRSTRSSPFLVRRSSRRSPGLSFSDPVLRADADDPQRRIRGDLGRPGHTAGTVVATRRFAPRNEAYPLRTDTLVSIRNRSCAET